jgi:tellurium resistance protein TerD
MPVKIVSKPGKEIKVTDGVKPFVTEISIGWDPKPGNDVDMDISVIMRDKSGVAQAACYYADLAPFEWITHSADDTTGSSSAGGADEFVTIEVHKVDKAYNVLDIFANIYDAQARGQCWGVLDNVFIEILDKSNGNKIRVEPNMDLMASSEVSMLVARITRNADGSWSLREVVSKTDSAWTDLATFANITLPPGDM